MNCHRLFLVLFLLLTLSLEGADPLQEAASLYKKGEQAEDYNQRSKFFNQALQIYTSLEGDSSSSRLLTNIGNTYYHLGEFPMAVFYYKRALSLDSGDEKARSNLPVALKALGIKEPTSLDSFPQVTTLASLLKWISFALFFVASIYIWTPSHVVKKGIVVLVVGFTSISLLLTYTYYFGPIYGVVVQTTPLYKDGGYEYATVREEPVVGGSEILLLNASEEGDWIRVKLEDGNIGFLPGEVIRIINQ